jgi:excisionase family DNA binding protein
MTVDMAPLVLTVEEAAGLLRIGRTAAYEAAKRGELPVIRLGRSLRVSRHALEQLLNGHGPADEGPQENGAGETAPQEKEVSSTNGHHTAKSGPG